MSLSRPFHFVLLVLAMALSGCAQPASPAPLPQASPPAASAGPAATQGPAPTPAPPSPTPGPAREQVQFKSGDLMLTGYVYKPEGAGPFPAIVWNHGSDIAPNQGGDFDAIASAFVPAGYVVFAPIRRGVGSSDGQNFQDQVQQEAASKGAAAAQQLFVQLMSSPQLDDQLAGLAYLKTLPYVDTSRLAVAGCSYGGIQALLGAEKGAGYNAAVALSPAADTWDSNPSLQQALTKAADATNIPVFLIHPEGDTSVAPGYTLAREFLKRGKAYSLKVYPPFGPSGEQGICFGGAQGVHWWSADALSFIGGALSTSAAAPSTGQAKTVKIKLQSDGFNLVGYAFKPDGPGPFPGIIWNHGSEQNPTIANEFGRIGQVFAAAGYVLVAPVRRGQGGSEGPYIVDQSQEVGKSKGHQAAQQFLVDQMEGPQLDDQLAGATYLKSLPFVDPNRIAVVGCSYGGIQTLMGAASSAGYKAAVALSPGAESWVASTALQQALISKVREINIPTLIIHPAKDASLEPGYALGPQFQQLGKPYGLQIFPPFGKSVEHCFLGGDSPPINVWAADVFAFLSEVLH